MEIIQLDPTNRRQVRQFLDLPFAIYRDNQQWVPPIMGDLRKQLDPRRHAFYEHSQAAFFLALEGNRPVGRLGVVDNANYNRFYDLNKAFFYLFECVDDVAVSNALFDAGMAWAKARGRTQIKGPKGMELLDGLGLLVKGYEHAPAFGIPYNLPYYGDLVEAAGFVGIDDVMSGAMDPHGPFPERIHDLADKVLARRGLRILTFNTRREIKRIVPALGRLYNRSLGNLNDDVPLTDGEIASVVGTLLGVADPKLVKIVAKGDELVGFVLAYPDVGAALRRCKGRVWPFGWWHLLREFGRTDWVNVNGMGILEQYRGLGGSAILFSELHKTLSASRFQHADLVQIYATNGAMQREIGSLAVDFYKTHRIYERDL